MVVQGLLDFYLLLGCDYVYDMGALVSSLFHVICFLHEGRINIIEKISFISPNLTPNQPNSLNGPYMQVVYSSPQIKYVETCSMPAYTDDLVGDALHHALGALETDISIRSFDIYSLQNIVLPSDERFLEDKVSGET